MSKSHSFWVLAAIVFLALGTIIGFTVQARNREADRRVAREACVNVNHLREGTLAAMKVIQANVDLPAADSDAEREMIADNYIKALALIRASGCDHP
jgi:hypothetical protein